MPKTFFQHNTYFWIFGQNDISTGFPFWILATALHVHSEVNWIFLECFALRVVALILDACLCFSNHCWMLTQRSEPFVYYAFKGSSSCPEDHEVKAGGPSPYTLLFTLPQRKIIQQCKAKQSCRPLNVVP